MKYITREQVLNGNYEESSVANYDFGFTTNCVCNSNQLTFEVETSCTDSILDKIEEVTCDDKDLCCFVTHGFGLLVVRFFRKC